MINRNLVIFALLTLLGACASNPDKIDTIQLKHLYMTVPMFHPPEPEELVMAPVSWKVVTPKIARQELDKIKTSDDKDFVWFTMTPMHYENLSNNIAELKRYIKQQQAIINYYRKNATGMTARPKPIPGMAKSDSE